MPNPIKVSASILCADFKKLGDEIKKCEDAGADMIHVDVMDGHFVPNISIGAVIVEAIRPITKLPIETHLMIENPTAYLDTFITAGADIISIQVECYGVRRENCRLPGQYPKEIDSFDVAMIMKDIQHIQSQGKKAFVVFNPGTPLCVDPILKDVDGVLIMSVNPGFAKQKFMPVAIEKIKSLREKYRGIISVDGGVNDQTAPAAVKAGADLLITASYFFGAPDQKKAVGFLKGLS